MGVIDGHDVHALRDALREAFEADRPVVVHIHTVKGKGFAPAEEGGLASMEAWHAAKPHSIVNGKPAADGTKSQASVDVSAHRPVVPVTETDSPEGMERLEEPPAPSAPPQYTQVFAEAIVAEAERDERVIGITAAMAGGTGLQKLADELPGQYYDVGIAEQNAVLLASGLALQGAKPVCAIYSTFLQRAYDQIIHDVCLQELDVTFAMDRAGLVGDDGPTHHGAFDVSYFRPIPNVVLMAPRDEAMLVQMLYTAISHDGPAALRYPRGAAEGVALPASPELLALGSGEILAEGERVALLGFGYGVTVAREAATLLAAHDLTPTVADARFAKPLDGALVERLAAEHDLVVTIEENVLPGGFGAAVLEHLEDAFGDRPGERARVLRVGIPDRYVTHGKPELLRAEVGLSGESVAERVLSALPSRSLA